MFTLTLSSYFGSPGESWLHINVVFNWQLSQTRYPLTSIIWPYRGLRCRPIKFEYFLKLSADNLLFFKWSQAQIFFKFISNMLCLFHYRPVLLRCWFKTDLRRKNSASLFKIHTGKTFSYHGHVLVTLHVQFLCSDCLKFDRWDHA